MTGVVEEEAEWLPLSVMEEIMAERVNLSCDIQWGKAQGWRRIGIFYGG